MTFTIFMAGDSTAAHKEENKRPETGWFEKINLYLSSNVKTKNFAFNGASTKTFLEKNLLSDIDKEINAGDYLLIQFGHNDQKVEDPNWGTTIDVYEKNLQKFIDVANKHHATPIILSSIVRRKFDGDKLNNTLGEYPSAARSVANKNKIPFIDLNSITYDYVNNLGPTDSLKLYLNVDRSDNYPNGVHDNTHLNDYGAKTIAGLSAIELKKLDLPLSHDIFIEE